MKENHDSSKKRFKNNQSEIRDVPATILETSSDRVGSMDTQCLDSSVLERNVLVLVCSATGGVVRVRDGFGMERPELHEYYVNRLSFQSNDWCDSSKKYHFTPPYPTKIVHFKFCLREFDFGL